MASGTPDRLRQESPKRHHTQCTILVDKKQNIELRFAVVSVLHLVYRCITIIVLRDQT